MEFSARFSGVQTDVLPFFTYSTYVITERIGGQLFNLSSLIFNDYYCFMREGEHTGLPLHFYIGLYTSPCGAFALGGFVPWSVLM